MNPLERVTGAERERLRQAAAGWYPPMLATLTHHRFSDEGWIFEPKLDGVRTIASWDGSDVSLWSRNHNAVNVSYPEIVSALGTRADSGVVVDGEIVAFHGDITSFAALQPRIHLTDPRRIAESDVTVYYYIFDILHYTGYDLTNISLRTRKSILSDAVTFDDPIRLSTHRNTDGEQYYRQACERGWEGVIAKRTDSRYRSGRSGDWLKFKCEASQELVIGGFTEPRGSRSGFGALLVGYYEGKQLRYAGKVGTGYDENLLISLRSRLDGIEVDSAPFAERVAEPGAHWVRPELVGAIEFSEWTQDGKLRHPRFLGLRSDKPPQDVVREDQ